MPAVIPATRGKHLPASVTNSDTYKDERVRWTAREIDHGPAPERWRRWELSAIEIVELLRFLDELTQKTWRQCESETSNGHKRNHDHAITDLLPVAQERLRVLDDNEERVFRFRLNAKSRLWGFRSGSLFRILWYDQQHEVYPVEKRHT